MPYVALSGTLNSTKYVTTGISSNTTTTQSQGLRWTRVGEKEFRRLCQGYGDEQAMDVIEWIPRSDLPQDRQAILHQTNIGWCHVFMGHLATKWPVLHTPKDPLTNILKTQVMWTASIMEVSTRLFNDLWEIRKKDVHGHTETKQNSRLKAKHQETFKTMLAQKLDMRPCNHWLFPENPTLFLATTTAHRLGTWIASRHHTVRHSVKAAKKEIPPTAKYCHIFYFRSPFQHQKRQPLSLLNPDIRTT